MQKTFRVFIIPFFLFSLVLLANSGLQAAEPMRPPLLSGVSIQLPSCEQSCERQADQCYDSAEYGMEAEQDVKDCTARHFDCREACAGEALSCAEAAPLLCQGRTEKACHTGDMRSCEWARQTQYSCETRETERCEITVNFFRLRSNSVLNSISNIRN